MEELTCADLPLEPSEKLIQWARQKLIGDIHALVYRSGWYRDPLTGMRGEVVDCLCSSCHTVTKLPKVYAGRCGYAVAPFGFFNDGDVIDGNSTLCPNCGAPVQAVYANRISSLGYTVQSAFPVEIRAIRGRLVLLKWGVSLVINEDGVERIEVVPSEGYVVEKKKISCFSGKRNYYHPEGWNAYAQYKDRFGVVKNVYPWKAKLLEGTTAENSKLDLYLKCKGNKLPVSYLKLWLRRPHVENLLVQGMGNLLAEMIARDALETSYYCGTKIPELADVNWKEKRPAQMLGLTKEELRCAREQKWSLAEWEVFRDVRARGVRLDPDGDMKLIHRLGAVSLKSVMDKSADFPVMKTVRYLLKGKKRDTATLTDYWRMAAANGSDLNDNDIRFPQDLKRAHDTEAARQRVIKDEKISKLFVQREAVLSRYAFEADGLLIRPAATPEELYNEGETLHHCVYSYRENHANGKTAIFLIRKADEPEKPYFTLELDEVNMAVRQNRGKCNCSRTAEVRAFEDKWLDWAKGQKYERSKSA